MTDITALRPSAVPVPTVESFAGARQGRTVPKRASSARRRHAARDSKIAATGLGFAAMLGMVAAMARTGTAEAPPPPATPPDAPAEVLVVFHRSPAIAPSVVGDGGAVPASGEPIVLTAQPTVRPAPASSAPRGRTNGSR